MESETLLKTYHDHYKDTYKLIREAQVGRNKSFVGLCILETIAFLLVRNPDFIYGLINDAINKKLETTILFGNAVLQSFVWVLLTYFLIRYIQFTIYIERQYSYIDNLEKKIQKIMGHDSIFNREGGHYLKDYPTVLNLIDLFYKMFCPLFFIGINTIHIYREWKVSVNVNFALVVDSISYIVVFILTCSFFFGIHTRILTWCKKHIVGFAKITDLLHSVLKNV